MAISRIYIDSVSMFFFTQDSSWLLPDIYAERRIVSLRKAPLHRLNKCEAPLWKEGTEKKSWSCFPEL